MLFYVTHVGQLEQEVRPVPGGGRPRGVAAVPVRGARRRRSQRGEQRRRRAHQAT